MSNMNSGETMVFSAPREGTDQSRAILYEVFAILTEKGYDPFGQIIGYLVTEDPAYITNYKGARSLISRLDRDELLEKMLHEYLKL